MKSVYTYVDPCGVNTAEQTETDVNTVKPGFIPIHNRILTAEEVIQARSHMISAYATCFGSPELQSKCRILHPTRLRKEFANKLDDRQLVAFFYVSIFHSPSTLDTILGQWLAPAGGISISDLLNLVLYSKFKLEADAEYIYPFGAEGYFRFSIPISDIPVLKNNILLLSFSELIERRHLWRLQPSADGKNLRYSEFAFNPEFRACVDRSVLVALILRWQIQPNSSKVEEIRRVLATAIADGSSPVSSAKFGMPWIKKDLDNLRGVLKVILPKKIKLDALSEFCDRFDMLRADEVPEDYYERAISRASSAEQKRQTRSDMGQIGLNTPLYNTSSVPDDEEDEEDQEKKQKAHSSLKSTVVNDEEEDEDVCDVDSTSIYSANGYNPATNIITPLSQNVPASNSSVDVDESFVNAMDKLIVPHRTEQSRQSSSSSSSLVLMDTD